MQVRAFVASRPDLELIEEKLTLPAAGSGDGGYYAVVKRRPERTA